MDLTFLAKVDLKKGIKKCPKCNSSILIGYYEMQKYLNDSEDDYFGIRITSVECAECKGSFKEEELLGDHYVPTAEFKRNLMYFWDLPSTTRRSVLSRFKSMKEIINSKIFTEVFDDLYITDMRKEDWQELDLDICPIGTHKDILNPKEMPVLNFILNQIEHNPTNFFFIPDNISSSKEFRQIAIEYNPNLARYIKQEEI